MKLRQVSPRSFELEHDTQYRIGTFVRQMDNRTTFWANDQYEMTVNILIDIQTAMKFLNTNPMFMGDHTFT